MSSPCTPHWATLIDPRSIPAYGVATYRMHPSSAKALTKHVSRRPRRIPMLAFLGVIVTGPHVHAAQSSGSEARNVPTLPASLESASDPEPDGTPQPEGPIQPANAPPLPDASQRTQATPPASVAQPASGPPPASPIQRARAAAVASVAGPSANRGAAASGLVPPQKTFEVLFSGNARIQSFMYFHYDAENWIDTIVALESRILRYKSTYLIFQYENETDMGHRTDGQGVFDPDHGRWMFDLGTRTEFSRHFLEVWLFRHDCFHGIDRFYPGQDFKGMSEGIGFGSTRYLPQYRFRDNSPNSELRFPFRFDYYLNPLVYLPQGDPWQRHPYRVRVNADLRLQLLRWAFLGLELESLNVFYVSQASEVQHSHLLRLDAVIYGSSAAMMVFVEGWPYDDQVFRSREGRAVFGLELDL